MTLGTYRRAAFALAGSLIAAAAVAQTVQDPGQGGLDIPANPQFLVDQDQNVRKATAIVNGAVITGTDVDQRLALIIIANQGRIPPEEVQRIREQVLRNLVDETLQIQAAAAQDITVTPEEIDRYYARYAQSFGRSVEDFTTYLRANGSSDVSIKRQIQGELAWSRLQRRQIEPFVNVSEEEVRAVIARLNASRGTQQFKVSEIFLSATPETAPEMAANAARIVQQIRGGASFPAYARQFSEASTAAVGGDLGWVQAEQLPDVLAGAIAQMPVGQVSDPIAIPGGFSILLVQDKRQVLTADPRDAVLSLKQLSITFPAGTTREQATARIGELARVGQAIGGCGGADAAAASIGAEVISSDQIQARNLPLPLQESLLRMNVGQATSPFGSMEEGVRILVLCGRDDPAAANEPTFEQIYEQINEERVNRRARLLLRDLRRDAVIDYR